MNDRLIVTLFKAFFELFGLWRQHKQPSRWSRTKPRKGR